MSADMERVIAEARAVAEQARDELHHTHDHAEMSALSAVARAFEDFADGLTERRGE